MKRILLTLLTFLVASLSYSQHFPVEFMGIPVDGNKEDVANSLIEKGFQYVPSTGNYTGEFNGIDVNLAIVTTKGRVSRICLCNKKGVDKSTVKTLYNNLVYDFQNNTKYFRPLGDTTKCEIPYNENIEHEILINDKNYEVCFFQLVDLKKPEVIKAIAKYLNQEVDLDSMKAESTEDVYDKKLALLSLTAAMRYSVTRKVWFFIARRDDNRYFINLYYDNEDNRPHGEDL